MNKRSGLNPKIFIPILIFLVFGNVALLGLFVLPGLTGSSHSLTPETSQPSAATPSLTATEDQAGASNQPSPTFAPTATLPPEEALAALRKQGALFFSMSDGTRRHLFAYHPQFFSLTRLTNSPWDDIRPVVSPDGTK